MVSVLLLNVIWFACPGESEIAGTFAAGDVITFSGNTLSVPN